MRLNAANSVRLLIDTRVFLWLETEPERVTASVLQVLQDAGNELLFSVVSGWEIAIKYSIGKLTLPAEPPVYVPSRIARGGYRELEMTMAHALAVAGLPPHHDDPFARLLVAQAQVEGLTLVTADKRLAMYSVNTLSA